MAVLALAYNQLHKDEKETRESYRLKIEKVRATIAISLFVFICLVIVWLLDGIL